MEQATECAEDVRKIQAPEPMKPTAHFFKKLYYVLTFYMPRRLPKNLEELMKMKEIFITYYGLEDRPDIWFTVCGQISATPATHLRKPYSDMVKAAKRLAVNRLARDAKIYFNNLNEEQIKILTENVVASPRPESDTTPEPAA